jgi:hypothetical protein
MDYVTRQFIQLVKHFRKDLRKSLAVLSSALQKQTEAIRGANQRRDDEQRPSPEIIATVNFPERINIHQEAEDARSERNYKRATFFVTALTFGAIAVYADLVYWQYREMQKTTIATQTSADAAKDAAKTARESLEAVQRAFVFMDRADAEVVHPAPNTENVLFTFKWQNSGSTPATLFKSHINYLLDPNPMPKDFSFKDSWEPGIPRINVEGFIGPKAEVGIPLNTPISVAEIKAIAQHRGYLYVWGWAKYHDVFAKTPEHVSKFCVEIVPDFHIEGNVTKFSVGLRQCLVGHYTCVDSQCKP